MDRYGWTLWYWNHMQYRRIEKKCPRWINLVLKIRDLGSSSQLLVVWLLKPNIKSLLFQYWLEFPLKLFQFPRQSINFVLDIERKYVRICTASHTSHYSVTWRELAQPNRIPKYVRNGWSDTLWKPQAARPQPLTYKVHLFVRWWPQTGLDASHTLFFVRTEAQNAEILRTN